MLLSLKKGYCKSAWAKKNRSIYKTKVSGAKLVAMRWMLTMPNSSKYLQNHCSIYGYKASSKYSFIAMNCPEYLTRLCNVPNVDTFHLVLFPCNLAAIAVLGLQTQTSVLGDDKRILHLKKYAYSWDMHFYKNKKKFVISVYCQYIGWAGSKRAAPKEGSVSPKATSVHSNSSHLYQFVMFLYPLIIKYFLGGMETKQLKNNY